MEEQEKMDIEAIGSLLNENKKQAQRIKRLEVENKRFREIEDGVLQVVKDSIDAQIEAAAKIEELEALLKEYREKRMYDGLNGRVWHAEEHWQAEQKIRELEGE